MNIPFASALPPVAGPAGPQAFPESPAADTWPVALALSADGTAFMMYSEYAGGQTSLKASRFTPTGGWERGVFIETNSTGSAGGADLVADAHGNAYASFNQLGPQSDAYVARYVAGEGWQPPELLDNLPGEAQRPSLAVTPNGTLFAAWYQFDGAYYSSFVRRYTPAAGWGPIVNIEALAGHGYNDPSIGVDALGNAICVWNQDDSGVLMTFANRYVAGSGWGMASAIETNRSNTVTARVSVGADGSALAAWTKGDSGGAHVYTNTYTPGLGWRGPLLHANTTSGIQSAIPLVDSQGNALVAFTLNDGVRYNGWADMYRPATGWSGTALFETMDGNLPNQFSKAQVSSDGAGDFLLVYSSYDGTTSNAYASWYVAGQGWAPPARIEDTSDTAYNAVSGLGSPGEGWLAWAQYNGTLNSIWFAAFRIPDITPPPLDFAVGTLGPSASVSVTGLTEPGATVVVNGVVAAVESDGHFRVRIALADGTNPLAVVATDAWGNSARSFANITFTDPSAALQTQLDAANAALASALGQVDTLAADLNATQGDLTAATADLSAAQAHLAAVEASGNATQADLDAAQTSLTAAQASVTALQTAQASFSTQLTAATANASAAQTAAAAAQAAASTQTAEIAASQAAADSAKSSAASASTMGMLGAALGIVGIAVGAIALMRGRGGGGAGGSGGEKKIEGANTNPLYKDEGRGGQNPLYEKKE